MSKPTLNDVVLIPRALHRGRFIITDTKRAMGRNYVHLVTEHDGAWQNGWIMQSSVEHCWSVAIAYRGVIESMSGCLFDPARYQS